MSRFLKFFAIALFSMLLLVPAASAQRGGGRGFGGGGFGGRGFGARGFGGGFGWGGWGGGYFGPGWGWYDPYWYGYGWGYPYYAYGPAESSGSVKIEKAPRNDAVYVDGGYAGTVGELMKFKLRPGNHDIEVRDPDGHTVDKERIQVIAGKTVEIRAKQGGR